jgi:4-diphosphocytidyl-2-C-methyl-D-erythritol kinase
MSSSVRIRAHAKINLALRVGTPGADGFHPIATIFQTVSLCDLLYAEVIKSNGAQGASAPGVSSATHDAPVRLRVEGAELPADNTVSRAVGLLADEVRAHGVEPAALDMLLCKRVPLGAGLGGGSSDAVAALAACARLWHVSEDLLEWGGALHRIAAEIGSDVPFFLTGGTAMGTGRGARIEPLEPLPPTWFVLAAPDLHVSTPDAYAAFDRLGGAASPPGVGGVSGAPHRYALPPVPAYEPRLSDRWMGNDLAAAVCARYPQVAVVRDRLLELGAHAAQMTGSGAATFGAFAQRREAARAAQALRAEGLWAGAFVSITSDQHRGGLFAAGR